MGFGQVVRRQAKVLELRMLLLIVPVQEFLYRNTDLFDNPFNQGGRELARATMLVMYSERFPVASQPNPLVVMIA